MVPDLLDTVRVVRDGLIAGAGLDIFENEPTSADERQRHPRAARAVLDRPVIRRKRRRTALAAKRGEEPSGIVNLKYCCHDRKWRRFADCQARFDE